MRGRIVVLSACLLATASSAVAQTPSPPNGLRVDPQTFAAIQARVGDGDRVRVRGSFGRLVLQGPTLSPDSLVGIDEAARNDARINLADVRRIDVRGRATGTGALVGGGVGLVGGLALALAVTGSLCSDGLGCDNESGGTAVLTIGSAAGGMLLGALIGSGFGQWHRIYPAR